MVILASLYSIGPYRPSKLELLYLPFYFDVKAVVISFLVIILYVVCTVRMIV